MADNKNTPASASTVAADAAGSEPQELTVFVQNLLQQMQSRFQTMSDTIISKIDEMGGRIDELEKNLSDLMTQAGGAQPAPTNQQAPHH